MKKSNIILFTLAALINTHSFAYDNYSHSWRLFGIDREITVTNDSDTSQYFTVTTVGRMIVGGDVAVTPNSVKVTCIDGNASMTLKPGFNATCVVKPYGVAKITMIPSMRHDWGAEGTYQFKSMKGSSPRAA